MQPRCQSKLTSVLILLDDQDFSSVEMNATLHVKAVAYLKALAVLLLAIALTTVAASAMFRTGLDLLIEGARIACLDTIPRLLHQRPVPEYHHSDDRPTL